MISVLLTLALAQAPAVDPNAPLPPGHPSMAGAPAAPAAQPALPPGHPPTRGGVAKTAEQLVRDLDAQPDLKEREKSFEVAGSIGKLYYGRGRFEDAAVYLGQAWDKAKALRAAAGKIPAKAGECADRNAALDDVVAKLKTQPEAAAGCARMLLQQAIDLGEMRALALFLTGDGKGALALLDELLQLSPERPTALYLRGAIRFDRGADDPAALKKAKADLERAEKLEPRTAQAARARELIARADQLIAAGGAAKLAAKNEAERQKNPPKVAPPQDEGIAPVSGEAMEAIQNTERTPELVAGLAKLVEDGEGLLAKGKYDEALANYVRVVPFEPENARARAGMAWAMVGLKKPTAEKIWSVAVTQDPSSVDQLGQALQQKGDAAGAKALWTKLSQSAPEYAQKAGLAARLK